jgi:hypothetical protein
MLTILEILPSVETDGRAAVFAQRDESKCGNIRSSSAADNAASKEYS